MPENSLVLHQLREGDINHAQIRALKSMQGQRNKERKILKSQKKYLEHYPLYSTGLLILSSLGSSWQLRADWTGAQAGPQGLTAGLTAGTPLMGWDPRRAPGCRPSILGAESREGSEVSSLTPFPLPSPLRNAGYLPFPVRARSPITPPR